MDGNHLPHRAMGIEGDDFAPFRAADWLAVFTSTGHRR
jgi:hypothetical protein